MDKGRRRYYSVSMSTKPKFLSDIEKRILKNNLKSDSGQQIELFREVFTILIENIQTFGPILGQVKAGYEDHLRQLRENCRLLDYTNGQLYLEMRKFQEEISSDDEEGKDRGTSKRELRERETEGLIEKLRKKREKEKERRAEKLRIHQDEVERYQGKLAELQNLNQTLKEKLQEKETKHELLAEEFNNLQKNFSAYKASIEDLEDPFVLRLALNVTRRQLWDLQNKMNDIGEDGASIILSQRHHQEMEEMQRTVDSLELERLKLDHSVHSLAETGEKYEVRLAELETELADMRDSATPRPDWRRCGSVVEGGEERWSKLVRGDVRIEQIEKNGNFNSRKIIRKVPIH